MALRNYKKRLKLEVICCYSAFYSRVDWEFIALDSERISFAFTLNSR